MTRFRLGIPVVLFSLLGFALLLAPQRALGQQPVTRILLGQETDDFPAVGIVGSLQRGGFCTGTLISPTHVLTAAHCAEVIENSTSGTFELGNQTYQTSDIFIHPDFNALNLANDIAILQLNEPVLDVEPSEIFRSEPLAGDLLFIVGFGATGSADGGSDGSFGTKRVGVTTIDEVTSTLVSWIFDDESEANTAAGDSGGPGYIDIDGDLFVASVTSGGTEPDSVLGDFAFNTRVDAFSPWVDLTIATSGNPPDSDDPTTDPPSGDPVNDDPTTDPPSGDPVNDDPIWSQPFPFLQLLIDFLTQLLELLTDGGGTEPADSPSDTPTAPSDTPTAPSDTPTAPSDTPTAPSDTPTAPSDTPTAPSDTPTTETTVDCPAQDPTTEPSDPTTESSDPTTESSDPTTESSDPTTEPSDPTTENPGAGTQPPDTTTLPGGIVLPGSIPSTSDLGTRFNRLRESLGAITDFQQWSLFRRGPPEEDR